MTSSRNIPDNILLYHKVLAYFVDLGALVTYTLDRSLSDRSTRVTDFTDVRIVKIVINDSRGPSGGEFSREDLEGIIFG